MSLDKFVQRRKRKIEETDKGGEEIYKGGEEPDKITRKLKLGDEEPSNITPELKWRKLTGENLNCDYVMLFTKDEADQLFRECSDILEYNTGHLAKVKVFGKWHDIPRKQVY
jgi:alpha-ketoglutarate-dependent dioxygenase alkB family protein 2